MKSKLYFSIALSILLSVGLVNAEPIENCLNNESQTTVKELKSIDNLSGNFNNKIEIVFSDIDGTLMPFNKNAPKMTLPESLNEATAKLKQAGIPLVLVTGRPGSIARSISNKIGNTNSYVVGFHGAQIVDPHGNLIYKNIISDKDVKKIARRLNYFNKINNQNSKILIFTDETIFTLEKFHIPYLLEKVTVVKSIKNVTPRNGTFKVEIYEPDSKKLELVQADLKNALPEYRVDIVSDYFIDIYSKEASKGAAIKFLSDILKVDLKNAAAFGDAENDISMLTLIKTSCGLPIAVGNAMDSVKSTASYVTTPSANDGFAIAIDKILLNNEALK